MLKPKRLMTALEEVPRGLIALVYAVNLKQKVNRNPRYKITSKSPQISVNGQRT